MENPQKHSRIWPSLAKHICRLSDPVKTHELRSMLDVHPLSMCYGCKGTHVEGKRYYYYCDKCDLQFHRGCHIFPLEMKHPLHPSHPLTLISLDPDIEISKIAYNYIDILSDSDNEFDDDDDPEASPSYMHHDKCKCCQKPFEKAYYHCSLCNFSLNFTCTIRPPPLSILHPKSHDHTLTLFSRRIPLPCDACGLSLKSIHDVYACLPCNYMVHRSCITLPRVIRITRHQHRLYFISSFPSGDFSCGVCRLTIDVSCGHYSCDKGCHYAVHSKCATRKDVWDGIDLQEVPEEPEEDIEPFVRIDEETIQHFTHDHYLKLHGKGSLRGKKKFCEACCFPISVSDALYACMQCDFVLHEACACLLRVKHHPLHKHRLILHQSLSPATWPGNNYVVKSLFECNGCRRRDTGFVYRCDEKGSGL
ncbi:unnamed protein product [Thlaspi arvense]|uniref:DC1 domain-containing protein n=1 Tax=Thlaspi arvense TaxID=13288 RepID=A0AAU9SDU4_THLAR|nr:unnamed protein product [Thlaspi arvense]